VFCERLTLTSAGGVREIDLGHRVVCVVGPIDTGKTSLVDCIKYAFGGDVAWRQVPAERLTSVTLYVRIEGMRIGLRRSVVADTGVVELVDAAGQIEEVLDVESADGSSCRVVGEVLLELLGLSELFAPPTAVALLGAGARLTFEQLYPLCYLTQDMVDAGEAIRGRANTAQSYRTIVALLLGLIDAEMRVLDARKDDLTRTVTDGKRQARTVSGFLTGSIDGLEAELADARAQEHQTLTALEGLRARLRAATAFADPLRAAAEERERGAEAARRAADAAEHDAARARRHLDHLRARQRTGPAPLSPCPACHQDVSARAVPEGDCPLCLSVLDHAALAAAVAGAQDAAGKAAQHAAERCKARDQADEAWQRARAELDARTGKEISPLAGQIEQAAAAHAAARTSVTLLVRQLDPHRRLAEMQRGVRAAEDELREVRAQIATRKNLLAGRQTTLGEIEEHFAAIIDAVGLPGDPGARINHTTLLPQVRAGNLTKVGHGVRTAINVVYRMAFLSYALVTGVTDLPSLLIIDSPRKNVGYGQADQELIGRLYAHFLDHISGIRAGATRTRPYQIIIVDNDLPTLPPRLLRQMHTIELTRDDPLVQ
jgi:hypothetical protein